MNICIVYSARIDLSSGGVESVCKSLVCELHKKYKVNFYYVYTDGEFPAPDSTLLKLPSQIDSENWNHTERITRDFLQRNNIDIIWYHEQHNSCLQKLFFLAGENGNIKIVSVFHNNPYLLFSFLRDRCAYAIFNLCERRDVLSNLLMLLTYPLRYVKSIKTTYDYLRGLYAYSHHLVLLSNKFVDEFSLLAKISPANKLKVISNPVVPVNFQFAPEKKMNQILFVSRHVWWQKRIDRVIRIWKKIMDRFPNWELVILGDGPNHDDYVRIADKLKTQRLTFVGQQSPKEYYMNAKILCMTSSWEGFGLVLTEAQQFGCVPIAYRSYSSLDDIIEDGKTGYSVTPFNEGEYIDKLTHLMMDDELRENMALQAIQSVKKFHVDKIANDWYNLFSSLRNKA